MQSRRDFIRHAALVGGAMMLPDILNAGAEVRSLTILHTNDTHSRMEPFPMDGGRNQGMGGVAARAGMIHDIRKQVGHVLLLDAGDIFQGTPYFNYYKGEPEMKAMQMMGYDACTMGNHDFDGGIENFANQLAHVSFPVVICNYDFTGTPMEYQYHPYTIIKKGRLKIGITGVGIELKGLVSEELSTGVKYLDPVERSGYYASLLKKKGCDMVICLSHLGFDYKNDTQKISDIRLAKASSDIDLIIGGHTHTFLNEPVKMSNQNGKEVLINQVGWGGIKMGRLDYEFSSVFPNKSPKSAEVLSIKKMTE
jgi:5'-nucleotidase